MLKICTKCRVEKKVSEFHKSGDGFCSKCKKCRNEENRIYKRENSDKVKNYIKYYNSTDKANEQKKRWRENNTDYHKEYYLNNLDDIKDYQREWYLENKEDVLKRMSEYYLDNSEKIKNKNFEYYLSVKDTEEFKDRNRNYMKRRREEIPHEFAWRSVLRNSLRYLNTDKESRTIEMLGYSAEDLKLHIESLFEEGMSWCNWGEWHIDHIYPLSKFDKDTPVGIVNSLSNLQPLWAKDNIKKGNKIDG